MRIMIFQLIASFGVIIGCGDLAAAEPLSTDKVSAEQAASSPELPSLNMLPRGSALLTSSGRLKKKGIKFIIHAAPGAMSPPPKSKTPEVFEPTIDSVKASIANSLALAKIEKIRKLAVPLVGGGIWLRRIGTTPDELADAIVSAALDNRGDVQVVFVGFKRKDADTFRQAIMRAASDVPSGVSVAQGSITDPSVHGASAIVNAANMEVQFGGGLSGAIGNATGQKAELNAEASAAIRNFWRAQTP